MFWLVILKLDESMENVLNEPCAKLFAIKDKEYWKILGNTDIDRRIFIMQLSMMIVFKESMKFLYIFEKKYRYDISVDIKYLNIISLLDFKMYHPNMITNNIDVVCLRVQGKAVNTPVQNTKEINTREKRKKEVKKKNIVVLVVRHYVECQIVISPIQRILEQRKKNQTMILNM